MNVSKNKIIAINKQIVPIPKGGSFANVILDLRVMESIVLVCTS